MNENIPDEFSIFATGKRIKKEEPLPVKSPLEMNTSWGRGEVAQNLDPAPVPQPASAKITEENIGNVGAELQKFGKYPKKTFDKLLSKMVLFNEEEFFLIRDLSSEISIARKRSSMPNKGSLPRITENTVIRAALRAVFQKIGKTNIDLSTLQTEEALENYFNSLLK